MCIRSLRNGLLRATNACRVSLVIRTHEALVAGKPNRSLLRSLAGFRRSLPHVRVFFVRTSLYIEWDGKPKASHTILCKLRVICTHDVHSLQVASSHVHTCYGVMCVLPTSHVRPINHPCCSSLWNRCSIGCVPSSTCHLAH